MTERMLTESEGKVVAEIANKTTNEFDGLVIMTQKILNDNLKGYEELDPAIKMAGVGAAYARHLATMIKALFGDDADVFWLNVKDYMDKFKVKEP